MQFVRQSKFRHVFAKPLKREFCIEDVRVTKISWDSLFCAVNPKFIAVITEGSGGPFSVIPLSRVGRMDKDYPIVDAHKGPCLDICWCPFNDNVIASCSEDCTAKIWHIPDNGLTKNLKDPIVELLGHQKRVSSIVWHPVANNILLTAGADLKIFLWNVGTGEALIEIAGHPDLIWSVAFNYNGSKIVTTCKDKKIRVIDPRTGRILQQGMGHEGVKPQRAVFLMDGRIFTTGFTKRSERMYALRDETTLDEPIVAEELDTSNGVLYPLYDADSGLMYLCGKGDSNVRYYEINNDPPFVHYINVYSTSEPQRGIGFMPKRGLNINENEIARIYKCTNRGLVDVLQFFVPRKSELFQDDLYPDTPGTVPAISAEEWINGKDAEPIMMSLKGEKTAAEKSKAIGAAKKSNILAELQPTPATATASAAKTRKTPPANDGESTDVQQPLPSPAPSKTEVKKPKIDTDSGIMEFSRNNPPQIPKATRENFEVAREVAKEPPTPSATDSYPSRSKAQEFYSSNRDSVDMGKHTVSTPTETREFKSPGRQPLASRSESHGSTPSYTTARQTSDTSHPPRHSSSSARHSTDLNGSLSGSTAGAGGDWLSPASRSASNVSLEPVNMEEVIAEIQKLKTVVRRHERRIRYLEEQLHEKDLVDFDAL